MESTIELQVDVSPSGAAATTPLDGSIQARVAAHRYQPEELFVAYNLLPTDSEASIVHSVDVAIRQKCVNDAGIDEVVEGAGTLAPSAGSRSRRVDFLYFDNISSISQFGYFWPPAEPLPQAEASMSDAAVEVLSSCRDPVGDLYREIFEEKGLVGFEADVVDAEIYVQVVADPLLDELYSKWQMCMVESGFGYASLRGYSGPIPTETVEQALADARCRSDVGFSRRAIDLQAAAVDAWMEENLATVDAFRNAWAELARRSLSLLDR